MRIKDGDLLAFAFQGCTRGQDLFSEMLGGIGEWFTHLSSGWCSGYACGWQRSRGRIADLDQDSAILIHRELFGIDDFFLQIVKVRIIQREPPLQGPIRDPLLTRQHLKDLRQDLLKGHPRASPYSPTGRTSRGILP